MKRSEFSGKRFMRFFVIFGAVCFMAATGTQVLAAGRGPCGDDVAKFCKDEQPGRGGIAKCLKEHEDELSEGCRETITARKQNVQDFTGSCRSDIVKFCKDVKPGGGRVLQCLKEHENELSSQCKTKMSAARAK